MSFICVNDDEAASLVDKKAVSIAGVHFTDIPLAALANDTDLLEEDFTFVANDFDIQ